jgi:hypothetical protein
MHAVLDHLVFGTSSLDEGALWLEERLGVPLAPGGEHPLMGTHNRLLRLGEYCYLELIAINPAAGKPQRRRWFALDDPGMQDSIKTPRLIAWAAATSGLSLVADCGSYAAGPVHAMSRGSLHWLITIPDDGGLVQDGLLPALIEWPAGSHPAAALPDRGVRLEALELSSPDPASVMEALNSIGFETDANKVCVAHDQHGTRLVACIAVPNGVVRFDGRPSRLLRS